MMVSQIRIAFMGSPDFAVPALKLLAGAYPVVGVVTQPDRPAGRGRALLPPPVKVAALELGLPLLQPEKIRQPEVFQRLSDWNPDVIVVAAFGQILRQNVLDLAPFGCINIHASLLPRWRGAAPIQACILAGDVETGVTIMKLDAGLDTGPSLSQRAIPIEPEDTGGRLFDKLAALGGELLMDTLPDYLSGKIVPQPQDNNRATYAPMLKKEDGLLDLSQPAETLARRVRAFNPWPGTYFLMNELPLKVHAAHSQPGSSQAGKRSVINGKPAISTAAGLLVLDEVQPPGRKSMPGKAFLAGARDWLDPR
jgi:methionyl-tRNA formyltransferase